MTRCKSLLGERSQSLAVFEFDENSRLFRILPLTGSFALPYCHNTVARSSPPPLWLLKCHHSYLFFFLGIRSCACVRVHVHCVQFV